MLENSIISTVNKLGYVLVTMEQGKLQNTYYCSYLRIERFHGFHFEQILFWNTEHTTIITFCT